MPENTYTKQEAIDFSYPRWLAIPLSSLKIIIINADKKVSNKNDRIGSCRFSSKTTAYLNQN